MDPQTTQKSRGLLPVPFWLFRTPVLQIQHLEAQTPYLRKEGGGQNKGRQRIARILQKWPHEGRPLEDQQNEGQDRSWWGFGGKRKSRN